MVYSFTENVSFTGSELSDTAEKKRDDSSSAKPNNINLLPEITKNHFQEAKEAPLKRLAQPPLVRNTRLEYDKSQPTFSGDAYAEMNSKADMYGNHLVGNTLCKDSKTDLLNRTNNLQTTTKIKSETIKESGESLFLDNVEESSMTACTRLVEENQSLTSNLENQRQANGKTLKTNSALIANTDEFEEMCRIKRPMNSFILYSKDNRRIVCA